MLAEAGVPARYRRARLAEVIQPRDLLDWAERWSAAPVGLACLWGPVRTGKTFLAAAIAAEFLARYPGSAGESVWLRGYDLPDLIRDRVARGENPSGWIGRIARWIGLVVWDDYGVTRADRGGSGLWIADQLDRLICTRYDEGLPTLLTANFSPAELASDNPRIAYRVSEAGHVWEVGGPNRSQPGVLASLIASLKAD